MNKTGLIIISVGALGFLIILSLFFFMGGGSTGPQSSPEEGGMKKIIDNKADIYHEYKIEEWNSFRFNYKDKRIIQKEFNNGTLNSLIIKSDQEEKNNIFIGSEICKSYHSQCIKGGYGEIIATIYTHSEEEEVLDSFEKLKNSITNYEGEIIFDLNSFKKVIHGFLNAIIENNPDQLKIYATRNFANTKNFQFLFFEKQPWKSFNIEDDIIFFDNNQQEVVVKVHEYKKNKEEESGTRKLVIRVVKDGESYLIDNIIINQYQEN